MKKHIIITAVAVVLVILGVYSFQASNKKADHSAVFKLGIIAPLSGDYAGVAENVVKGMRVAKEVYTHRSGKSVELLVENDAGDASKGLSAYKKLTTQDKIDGLVNVFPTTMDAIYPLIEQQSYPVMMEFFQTNNVGDDKVFQMTPGNDGTWEKYAPYVKAQGWDDSNFVIVHSGDAAQISFAQEFAKFYNGKTTLFQISSDKYQLGTDAAKVVALKPTMIIFFLPPENGAILTKNILPLLSKSTKLLYDIQLYTGLTYYNQQLGGDLSKINGAISIMFEGYKNEEFTSTFAKLYPNEEPGFLADFGYDTFMTYMNAHDRDSEKWINNLKNTNYKGASGQVKFDKNGIRMPDLVIKKVISGKMETVDRLAF